MFCCFTDTGNCTLRWAAMSSKNGIWPSDWRFECWVWPHQHVPTETQWCKQEVARKPEETWRSTASSDPSVKMANRGFSGCDWNGDISLFLMKVTAIAHVLAFTLCFKQNVTLFYFWANLAKYYPISIIFGSNIPEEICNKNMHVYPPHLFTVLILYLVKSTIQLPMFTLF